MIYMEHDGEKITGIYAGEEIPDGCVRLPDEFHGVEGMYLDQFDENWELRDAKDLINDGIILGRAIRIRLLKIDMEAARPLRAILTDTATEHDRQKLKELEEEAREIRSYLSDPRLRD